MPDNHPRPAPGQVWRHAGDERHGSIRDIEIDRVEHGFVYATGVQSGRSTRIRLTERGHLRSPWYLRDAAATRLPDGLILTTGADVDRVCEHTGLTEQPAGDRVRRWANDTGEVRVRANLDADDHLVAALAMYVDVDLEVIGWSVTCSEGAPASSLADAITRATA